MSDPSADRPPAPPEKLFSEEDVETLAYALEDFYGGSWRDEAGFMLRHLATAGRLLPVDAEHREEWGVRVNEPHPRRREVVGDVISLNESQARYGPKIWSGWATVKRTVVAPGPWIEVDPDA